MLRQIMLGGKAGPEALSAVSLFAGNGGRNEVALLLDDGHGELTTVLVCLWGAAKGKPY
jgi:hypothetical protein